MEALVGNENFRRFKHLDERYCPQEELICHLKSNDLSCLNLGTLHQRQLGCPFEILGPERWRGRSGLKEGL